MEPLTTWERQGKIEWNPAAGHFLDTWVSNDINGPMYLVMVELDLPDGKVTVVREQRALIPSLAESRVRAHFKKHFPDGVIRVILVRRGRRQWTGWKQLARTKAYPLTRTVKRTNNGRSCKPDTRNGA